MAIEKENRASRTLGLAPLRQLTHVSECATARDSLIIATCLKKA